MAARSSRKRSDPVTCEALLKKLKRGQNELKSSMKNVGNGGRRVTIKEERRERKTLPPRFFERPLNRVDDFPKKRARTIQLSPDHVDSFAVHEPLPQSRKAHTRRLSSTPKQRGTSLMRRSPSPGIDVSLEEAILDKEGGGKISKRGKVTSDMNGSPAHLPSPKMSRIVVDTSRDMTTPGSSKKQRGVAKGVSPSLIKSGKSKKRGLSVSFVQVGDDNEEEKQNLSLKKKKGKFRQVPHHSTTKEDLGNSLIESLNSSRYGALDRTLAQTRKQHRFPRKYAGDDPRLGYDWIAGLLDASETYLSEKDDEYFDDIKEFRRVNHAECFRPAEALPPGSHLREDDLGAESTAGSSGLESQEHLQDCCTTCVSSYVMNDRMFPILTHPTHGDDTLGLCCPVCEGRHSREKSPTRYIRVSVPRSSLQVSSKVRPHRRRSFDPTDSMGLSRHCLAGWECAQPSVIPPQSTVDLKSSVNQTLSTKVEKKRRFTPLSSSASQRAARELLNTSHSVEYSLRSRATGSLRN